MDKPEGFDHLAWAKLPRSQFALDAIVRGSKEDARLRQIFDKLVADGIARKDGVLLFAWDWTAKQWIKV